ncbi:MAG: cytochrome c3 family protein [Desulfovibrionaceae bacterium]|nr:cytochrome c3 family protein [Desulfovibrionaceae bacterium]
MKYLAVCVSLVFGLSIPAFADAPIKIEDLRAATEKPVLLNHTGVVFNHSSHKTVDCWTCHHKTTSDKRTFVSCSISSECHDSLSRDDRSRRSYMKAIHNKKSSHSCMGCHIKQSATHASLKGCAPCHQ